MAGKCPYLEYRPFPDSGGESRAYCGAAERFVQPMRADICNGRYALDHETDCEIYRAQEGLADDETDGEAG